MFSFGMCERESLSHQQMWCWAWLCVLPEVTPWLIFKTYSDRDKPLCSTVYTSHLNCSLSPRLSISLQYVCWMGLSVVEGNDFSRLSEEWLKWFFFLTSFYSLLWLTSLQFWGPQSLSVGNNFRLGRGPIWGAFDVRCWRRFDGHVSRSACICLHSDEAQAPHTSSGYCSTQQSALFSLTWGLRTKSSLGGLYTVVYMYFNDFLF